MTLISVICLLWKVIYTLGPGIFNEFYVKTLQATCISTSLFPNFPYFTTFPRLFLHFPYCFALNICIRHKPMKYGRNECQQTQTYILMHGRRTEFHIGGTWNCRSRVVLKRGRGGGSGSYVNHMLCPQGAVLGSGVRNFGKILWVNIFLYRCLLHANSKRLKYFHVFFKIWNYT